MIKTYEWMSTIDEIANICDGGGWKLKEQLHFDLTLIYDKPMTNYLRCRRRRCVLTCSNVPSATEKSKWEQLRMYEKTVSVQY